MNNKCKTDGKKKKTVHKRGKEIHFSISNKRGKVAGHQKHGKDNKRFKVIRVTGITDTGKGK